MPCQHDNCKAHEQVRLVYLSNLVEVEQRCLLGNWSAEGTLAGCVACYCPAAVAEDELDGQRCSVA